VRGFNDRRPVEPRPKGGLRNKAALEHHIKVEHGDRIPDSGSGTSDVAHATLRWHHDVMHDNDMQLINFPHEH